MKVHVSTVTGKICKLNFHRKCGMRKALLSRKNLEAMQKFAKENVDKDHDLRRFVNAIDV